MGDWIARYIEGLGLGRRRQVRRRYAGLHASTVCPDFTALSGRLIEQLTEFRFQGSWIGMQRGGRREMFYSDTTDRTAVASVLSGFLRSVVASVLAASSARFYVEKNTWNVLWFDVIQELLPESRLVHIIRDPRDVVASFTSKSWMPDEPVLAARVYRDLMVRARAVRALVPEASWLDVKLEDLVAAPQSTIERICSFWGIPFHESMLGADLGKSNAGRWRTQLSQAQQLEVERECGELIAELGYR